jgi:GNAT superfamily N-acetyltransferase
MLPSEPIPAREAGNARIPEIGGVRIAPVRARDERSAAEVLARAFRDGPITRAVVGEPARRRLRSNRHGMRQSLRGARGHGSTLGAFQEDSAANPLGVLIAIRPGAFPLCPPSLPAQLHSVMAQGLGVAARWGDVYRTLADVHPPEPHWYLSLLGIDPPHQGRGRGRALLDAWLAEVDAGGHPSYLETDLEANLAFYARASFGVQHEIDVLGVRIWCLWRPGRCGSNGPDAPSRGSAGALPLI